MLDWFKKYWRQLSTPAKIYLGLAIVVYSIAMIFMLPLIFTGVGTLIYVAIIPIVLIALLVAGLFATLINIVYKENKYAGWGVMALLLLLGIAPAGL